MLLTKPDTIHCVYSLQLESGGYLTSKTALKPFLLKCEKSRIKKYVDWTLKDPKHPNVVDLSFFKAGKMYFTMQKSLSSLLFLVVSKQPGFIETF